MFLEEKSLLEIWLYPGLNFTIFRGTGPWALGGVLTGMYLHYLSYSIFALLKVAFFGGIRMFLCVFIEKLVTSIFLVF